MRLALPLMIALSACVPVANRAVPPAADTELLALLFDRARSIEAHLAPDFACVSLRNGTEDRDPGAALIAALSARWSVPVLPGSRCNLSGEGDTVAAPGVEGSGKWLRVANLQCTDADHCTADISYYVANLAAGGRSVAIERTAAGWRITPSGSMWIS